MTTASTVAVVAVTCLMLCTFIAGAMLRDAPDDPRYTLCVSSAFQFLLLEGHATMSADRATERAQLLRDLQQRGDLRAIYVIETPLDQGPAATGDGPRGLLARGGSELIATGRREPLLRIHRLR